MNILKSTLAGSAILTGLAAPAFAVDCPIKVGVLHSLSGTMAISETTLKDTDPDAGRGPERQGRRAGL